MPYDTLESLPAFVKRLSASQQKKWMAIWNETFRSTGSHAEAYKRANGSLELTVRWKDIHAYASRTKRFPLIHFMASDIFPDWEPSGIYNVQLMRTGLWREHPTYGDIVITKEDLAEAVRNFRNSARKPFLDDEHGITHPEWSSRPGESFGFMADMWIEDLDKNRLEAADALKSTEKVLVLRGRYEVNEEANDWIKRKAKAFFSPTFHPVYYDKETGELQGMTVVGGAMTNVPYFDGMDGYLAVASDHVDLVRKLAEMYPKSQFRLSRPEGMSDEEVVTSLEGMGLDIVSLEYWEVLAQSKEAGDLVAKLGELKKAGFTVSCFYQGVSQRFMAAPALGNSELPATNLPNATATPVRPWHVEPFYNR